MALQAAVALENARNHKRNVEFARVQQDLDAARNIQRSLLPQELPRIEGYSVGYRSMTCYEVGGDYLDILEQSDGSLLMAVADVAGKGLASAIMSTSFRSAFRAMALNGPPLDELATRMNQHHWQEGEEARRQICDRHLSAALSRGGGTGSGECRAQSRHSCSGRTAATCQFEAAGTPLGLLPGMRYASERCAFPPGARLLLYTDGLTEAFRGDEEFGPERLMANFSQCRSSRGGWYSRCIVDSYRGIC